jgi:hypothetical protein
MLYKTSGIIKIHASVSVVLLLNLTSCSSDSEIAQRFRVNFNSNV